MPRSTVSENRAPRACLRWHQLLGVLLLMTGLAMIVAPVARSQDLAGPVYFVQVQGTIDLGLAPYLTRVLDEAQRENASAVILDINTPGGRLDAALEMRQSLLDSSVHTIAFVNRDAFSAGALLAIAANEIYMVPGAVIGAATPVTVGGETADPKAVSAVRSTFKSTAETRGRDPLVAEAMVDPTIAIDGLVESGQLLSLTTTDARAWGYADGVVTSRGELLEAAGLAGAEVRETSPALAETVVRFITDPVVASLLVSAGILLVAADLFAGGGGLPGVAGVTLLGVFFWGHMLAGLAGWEGVALVGLGLVLLALEALVIPGFGIAGILGIAAFAGGLFISLIRGEVVTNQDLLRAASTVGLTLLTLMIGGAVLGWLVLRTGISGGLVLRSRLGMSDTRPGREPSTTGLTGAAESRDHAEAAGRLPALDVPTLTGARGVALSDLRPGGIAQINGHRVDVVTEGGYLTAGTPVEIIRDELYRRVVRKIDTDEADQQPQRLES